MINSTCKIINNERGITHQFMSALLLKLDDKLIINQHKIGNIFISYFLSVFESVKCNMITEVNSTMNNPINYLFKHYKEPFTKNTYGYDEISNRMIKLSSPFIISPLTYICNAALISGVFPDRLKYAIVKPIHKKGSKQDISNYRPISLLITFSKVFEK